MTSPRLNLIVRPAMDMAVAHECSRARVHKHATLGCPTVLLAHASRTIGWGCRRGNWSAGRRGRRNEYPWFWCVGSRATARTSNVAAAARTTGRGASLDRLEGSAWSGPDAPHSACAAGRAGSLGTERSWPGRARAPSGPPVRDASPGRLPDERRDRPARQHVCAAGCRELRTGGTKAPSPGPGPGLAAAPGSGRQRSFSEIVEELLTVFESSVVELTRTSLRT
jgi:hypothetical protein